MTPGDPNQIDSELMMYQLAMYTVAIRALVDTKKSQGETSINISPVDVIDFMLVRAEKYPNVLCIMIEMRYAEVIFMLQEAEKKRDADMFRTALKLIAPLCASTHATKYVSMITDFLTDWYCASDADKVIFAKAVLTRDTLHGKKIFTDRFVEWMMKDFRVWLGKYSTSHHESLFER